MMTKRSVRQIRNRILLPVLALFLGIVLVSYTHCNREGKDEILIQLVLKALDYGHYMPQEINNGFSENVYTSFVTNLDYGKRFFTAGDMEKLAAFKHHIDDEVLNGQFNFFNTAVKMYRQRLKDAETICAEILSKPVDLTKNDTFETDAKKARFAQNDAHLKLGWEQALRYQIVTKIYETETAQKAARERSDTVTIKPVEQLEVEARKDVAKLYTDYFSRLSQQNDNDMFALYLNAITAVYDPHTQYLPVKEKEDFDITMSGQFEGIGATLQASENYVKVVDIVPGSPSWLQGDLKVNDLIMKVTQEGEAEGKDLYGMRIDDAVKLIRGKKNSKVTLSVRHIDGSVEDITITRGVVVIEETYAKSAILVDSISKARVGYINLPKFYADMNNSGSGRFSAADVAAEIEKLRTENISGLILDLRNNGGGSLPDAVQMAGLFIESGPIVQVHSRDGRSRVLSDTDPAVRYDGSMVVMINPLSASASEIVAAALQDYKRAVIVGSPASFGKGTVQTIMDLDEMVRLSNTNAPKPNLGSLFLTIQKFFRINGGSTQLMGVKSDVVLPDLYSVMDIGEKSEEFPLAWTEIKPANYKIWSKQDLVQKAIERARERVATSAEFTLLSQELQEVKTQRDQTKVSLNYQAFVQREQERKKISERFDKLNTRQNSLDIRPLAKDQADPADSVQRQRNTRWINSIKKDIYLEEAVRITLDMKP